MVAANLTQEDKHGLCARREVDEAEDHRIRQRR